MRLRSPQNPAMGSFGPKRKVANSLSDRFEPITPDHEDAAWFELKIPRPLTDPERRQALYDSYKRQQRASGYPTDEYIFNVTGLPKADSPVGTVEGRRGSEDWEEQRERALERLQARWKPQGKVCLCDCGESMEGKRKGAKYINHAHKLRHKRALKRDG